MSIIELYKKNVLDVINDLVRKCRIAHSRFNNDETKAQFIKAIEMQQEYSDRFFELLREK